MIREVFWSTASVNYRVTKASSCSSTDEHRLDGGGHLGDLHADVRRIAREGLVDGAHEACHRLAAPRRVVVRVHSNHHCRRVQLHMTQQILMALINQWKTVYCDFSE